MDIRCLLLCVIFVCLCLCDQSVPASARTLQRAALKSEGPSADSVGREGSNGQAAEETEIRAYSEWRSMMTQEDLIQEGHSRGSLDASQGDAASAQRRLEETKDGSATKGEEGREQKPKENDTNEHEKESLDTKSPKAENSPDNAPTKSETGSTDGKTLPREIPPLPSSINTTKGSGDKVDHATQDDGTDSGGKQSSPAIQCGESHCEDLNKLVSACLRIQGDGTPKFSLFISYGGESKERVKVLAPEFLKADQPEVVVSKGISGTIQFKMNPKFETSALDFEEVKNTMITVTTECQIAVPIEYLRNSLQQKNSQYSSYSSFVTPMVGVYVLLFVFVLVLAGALLCYKCCGRKRSGDVVKYQQLEMNASGLGTPKERAEESTDGWDENWDDDWEDTEAVKSSSRLSQNLSSRGLAARRDNKYGWDSSWDD